MSPRDKQLKEKPQSLFLGAAGFVVRIRLEPTENVVFRRRLIDSLEKVWGPGNFLTSPKRADFEIDVRSGKGKMKILEKENGLRQYYLMFQKVDRKRVTTFYTVDIAALNIQLKDIFTFLVKGDGFIIHASSGQDRRGFLNVFLAEPGGGKTTLVGLLSQVGFEPFSDDMLIVRKVKGRWVYFSPPFVEKYFLPIKRKSEKAKFFFVKKGKKASLKKISNEEKILKKFLKQVWLAKGGMDKTTLKNVISFVADNQFYELESILNAERMKRLLDEN